MLANCRVRLPTADSPAVTCTACGVVGVVGGFGTSGFGVGFGVDGALKLASPCTDPLTADSRFANAIFLSAYWVKKPTIFRQYSAIFADASRTSDVSPTMSLNFLATLATTPTAWPNHPKKIFIASAVASEAPIHTLSDDSPLNSQS